MTRLLLCITLLTAWAGAALPASGAAFRKETAKDPLPMSACYAVANPRETGSFGKEPKYAGKHMYGQAQIANQTMRLVVFAKTEKGGFDSLILDANNNQDATDDPVIALPKKGESVVFSVSIGENKTVKARMDVMSYEADSPDSPVVVRFMPGEWYRGTVDVGGRKVNAALVDTGWDGLKVGMEGRDSLLLDWEGRGTFHASSQNLDFGGYVPLQPLMSAGGDMYNLSLDAEKPDVTLKRYEGACGELRLDSQLGPEWKDARFVGYILAQTGGQEGYKVYIVAPEKSDAPARLPVGSYSRQMMALTREKDGKPECVLQFSIAGQKPIEIEQGKTFTVTVAKPDTMTVTTTQNGDQLRIGKTLCSGNVDWSSLSLPGPDGEPKQLDAPSVEIFAVGKNDAPLTTGTMQYG
jgi:hypothetical protein